jgi:simple sugar transport system substrate-binding protein
VEGKPQPDPIVPAEIDLYTTPAQANAWLQSHSDGIP